MRICYTLMHINDWGLNMATAKEALERAMGKPAPKPKEGSKK